MIVIDETGADISVPDAVLKRIAEHMRKCEDCRHCDSCRPLFRNCPVVDRMVEVELPKVTR